jgi:hypothetical protein
MLAGNVTMTRSIIRSKAIQDHLFVHLIPGQLIHFVTREHYLSYIYIYIYIYIYVCMYVCMYLLNSLKYASVCCIRPHPYAGKQSHTVTTPAYQTSYYYQLYVRTYGYVVIAVA